MPHPTLPTRFGRQAGHLGHAGLGWSSTHARDQHHQQHLAQMQAHIASQPAQPLSTNEQADLLLMREEEKIARDIYLRLFERWGIAPFGNISGSEQVHMDAILALLTHHGLPDPAAGLGVGQFHAPALQALHDELLAKGLQSPQDAVAVGLHIEELDIADLQSVASHTTQASLLTVYAELERGSRNHLRAFFRWAQRLGIIYTPQHLNALRFAEMAQSPHEMC
jgi:hypothetical protein